MYWLFKGKNGLAKSYTFKGKHRLAVGLINDLDYQVKEQGKKMFLNLKVLIHCIYLYRKNSHKNSI